MVRPDGTAWNWGTWTLGQPILLPATVSGLTGAVAVSSGLAHVLVLKSDGSVWSWGNNASGQLGDGTTTSRTSPVQVSGLTSVVAIAAGGDHSLALRSDGTLWAWGLNSSGELGDGTTTNRTSPVQISSLSSVAVIAAGANHSLVAKSDGTAWAWGANTNGKLGDGTATNRTSPVQVSGLTGVVAVAAGGEHSLAAKTDGTARAWGANASGQLGDGTTTTRYTSVQVSSLSGITLVRAGKESSFARKSDGTAWAWGGNGYNQLGLGGGGNRTTAVSISGLTDVVNLAAGRFNGAAILGNDSARVWGDNSQAQIGDGTTTARTTPVWPIFYNAPDRLLEKFVCIQENLNYAADTVHPLPSGTYRIVVKGWGAGGGGSLPPYSQNLGGGGAFAEFSLERPGGSSVTLTPGRGLLAGGEKTRFSYASPPVATIAGGGGAGTAANAHGGGGGAASGENGGPGLGSSGGGGATSSANGNNGPGDSSSPDGNPNYRYGGAGGEGYYSGGSGGSGTTQGGGGGGGGSSKIDTAYYPTVVIAKQEGATGYIPGGVADPDYPGSNVGYGGSDGKGGNGAIVLLSYSKTAPPLVTIPLSATWTIGQPLSFQLTATNSLAHYAMTNIPPGLSLNRGTGLLTGTPTATGVYNSTITVEDAYGTGQANAVWTIALPGSDTVSPSVPSDFQFETLSDTSFRLMWQATDNVGVTGYEVRRNGTLYESVSSASSIVSGGTAGLTYTMTVRARDAAGNWSAWSAGYNVLQGTIGAPTPPTALNYADRTDTSITLIWAESTGSPPVVAYAVYRGGLQIATVGDRVYTDTGLSANTSYTYTVKALNSAGILSAASAAQNISTTNDTSTDSDHDGVPNAFEAVLGTNANSANPNDSGNQTQLKINQPQK